MLIDRRRISQGNLCGLSIGALFRGLVSGIQQTFRRQTAHGRATHAQLEPELLRAKRHSDEGIVLEDRGSAGLSQPTESPGVEAEAVQVQADP